MPEKTNKQCRDKRILILIFIVGIIFSSHVYHSKDKSQINYQYLYFKNNEDNSNKLYRFPANWKIQDFMDNDKLNFIQEQNIEHLTRVNRKQINFFNSSQKNNSEKLQQNPRINIFFNKKIPFNLIDLQSLAMLPGIGEKLANKIIDFEKNNPLCDNVNMLDDIHGVGSALVSKLDKYLDFNQSVTKK